MIRRNQAIGGLALAAAVAVIAWIVPWPSLRPVQQGAATVGGPFSLVDQTGRTVTEQTFRGKWMVVFFGFTHCPDICPTALNEMAQLLETLGPDAEKVAPIFITVDPERDTPDALAEYAGAFDKRITSLTGTPEEIAKVAKAYRVYFRKVPQGDSYSMDHTGIIYVMDPQGRFSTHFSPNTPAGEMEKTLRRLLS